MMKIETMTDKAELLKYREELLNGTIKPDEPEKTLDIEVILPIDHEHLTKTIEFGKPYKTCHSKHFRYRTVNPEVAERNITEQRLETPESQKGYSKIYRLSTHESTSLKAA